MHYRGRKNSYVRAHCVRWRCRCVRSKSRGIKQPPTGYQLISVCRGASARKINHILSFVFHFWARRMIFSGSRIPLQKKKKKKGIEGSPKLFSTKTSKLDMFRIYHVNAVGCHLDRDNVRKFHERDIICLSLARR